ncbi:MAG: trimethylamine methyltransferase family protein [Deltaproteobacteria bacterium]|nr:trimethylamine methyltransferase family protein [Deltaproteobacteria bacterium]
MAITGFKRNFAPLKILTDAMIDEVAEATFRILEKTGVVFEDEAALTVLADAGCKVDKENQRVRMPRGIVKEQLALVPPTVEIRARDPENNMIIGQDDVIYFINSGGMTSVDLETWESKEPTRREFYDFIKVLDALPNVHGLSAFPWYGFAKVPQAMRLIESCAAKVRCSSKIQGEGGVMDNDQWIMALTEVVGQDLMAFVNPVSPLTYDKESISRLNFFCDKNALFDITPGPLAGASGPATLAGTLAQCNAEIAAGMLLAQLLRPGVRVYSGHMLMTQDMRSGGPAFSSIGNHLTAAAFAQFWRKQHIPVVSATPAWCSSKTIDYQSGYEMALAATHNAMAGFHSIIYQGGLSQQMTAHPVKAIIDDDAAGMIGRFFAGIQVDEETLAVEVIDKVGPVPGTFLDQAHTRKWWRSAQYLTQVADHTPLDTWLKGDQKTALDHAKERMEQILSSQKPTPLEPGQEQAVEDILKEARAHYRKKGLISDEEWKDYQQDLNSPDYPFG